MEKKLCTCEPNWICENCQTIEKLQQEVSRLKNKIVNLGDMVKVSELKEFTKETMSCGDMASATDLAYCEGYNAALEDLLARFCKGESYD